MKVLFVSAEVAPYSKAGGLADVAGSLPPALHAYTDSIQILTPLYGQVNRSKYSIITTEISGTVKFGKASIAYQIHRGQVPGSEVVCLFVECDQFYARPGIYTEANGEGFPDNNERYFFFQLVILDLLLTKQLSVDILHCNDHHTGLLPALVKAFDLPIKTIFTIHNFLYHGHFSAEDIPLLPAAVADAFTKTQWDNYSALLEAIDHSDVINTVSPGYASELIQGINVDEHSFKHIQAATDKFSGIVNGIDIEYWSPEKDAFTPFHFNSENLDGKWKNKQALLEETGLGSDLRAPLIGSISRLVENKGFPLIVELLEEFVARGVKFIFLGSGAPEIADQLKSAQTKYPDHIAFDDGFNEPLAHLIESGSDMFLMPSRFEPCGLNQLYSLRYGTIPIVHRTGGLGDTVQDWQPDSGTGFVFEPYDINALRIAMNRAVDTFESKQQWSALMRRAMAEDYSWDQSAKHYLNLYKS